MDNRSTGQLLIGGNTSSEFNSPTIAAGLNNTGLIDIGGGSGAVGDQGTNLMVTGPLNNLVGGTILVSGLNDSRAITASIVNQGTIDVSSALTVNGNITNTGLVDLTAGKTLTLNSMLDNQAGGIIKLQNTSIGFQLTNSASATIEVLPGTSSVTSSAGLFLHSGQLTLKSGTGGNATLTVSNGFTNNGTITLDNSDAAAGRDTTLTVGTGTLLNNTLINTISSGGQAGNSRIIDAAIDNQGTLDIDHNTVLSGSSLLSDNGTIDIALDTTLSINGFGSVTTFGSGTTLTGTGTILFDADETLNIASAFTISSTGPTFDFSSTFDVVTVTGPGPLTLDAGVTLNLTDDDITTAIFTNSGTLVATAGTLSDITGAFTNQGNLRVASVGNDSATLTIASGFTNTATGTITIDTASTTSGTRSEILKVTTGVITNQGIIESTNVGGKGGTRRIEADITNTNAINVNEDLTIQTTAFDTTLGAISVANTKTLTITGGGTTTIGGSTTLTGTGTVLFNADETLTIASPFTISSSMPTFDFSSTFDVVTVTGPGPLTLDAGATLNLTDDDITTAIFTNSGTLVATAGTLSDITGSFSNQGNLRVASVGNDSATLTIASGFTNTATGTITIDTASTISGTRTEVLKVTAGIITNQGVIESTDSGFQGGTRRIEADITNTNAINVNEDLTIQTTAFDTTTGDISVLAGKTLTITGGGTTTIGSGTMLTGMGTILFNADETLTIASPFTITTSMPKFDFSSTFDVVTVTGPGPLTLDAGVTLNLTDDDITTAIFTNSGTLVATAGTLSDITGSFSNQGNLRVASVGNDSATLTIANGFTNTAAGTITIDTASTTSGTRSEILKVTTGVITNQGIIESTNVGGKGGTRRIEADITNTNAINVNEDLTIQTVAFDTTTGDISVLAGKTLTITGGGTTTIGSGTLLTGTGTILFNADETLTIASPFTITTSMPTFDFSSTFDVVTVNGPGPLTLGAGVTLNLTDDDITTAIFTNSGALVATAGTLSDITGAFTNQGSLRVEGEGGSSATLTIASGFTNTAAGTITIDTASTSSGTRTEVLKVTAGVITNQGIIESTDSGTLGGTRRIEADITNNNVINVNEDLTITGGIFNQTGATINIASAKSLLVTGIGSFTNDGTISLNGVTAVTGTTTILDVSGIPNLTNNGSITGIGTVIGTIFGNAPTVGLSPGLVTINGDFQASASSVFEAELEGTEAGITHDQLIVTGKTSLKGRMNVTLLNGYNPGLATSYIVLSAGLLLGTFDEVSGLDIANDQVLDLNYVDDSVILTAIETTSFGSDVEDNINASPGQDVIVSGAGDDLISSIGLDDIVYAQAGDDLISADPLFKRIDGGQGIDQLEILSDIDYRDFAGTQIENIEVISIDDGVAQTVEFDAASISRIIDGANDLTDINNSLLLIGDSLDKVILHGDFLDGGDQTYNVRGTDELFKVLTDADASILIDENVEVEVNRTDGSVLRYGSSGNDTLLGSSHDDFLDARQGSDIVDGAAGNDEIVYDGADILLDGGSGIDTLLINESVDLSGVASLSNIEKLNMQNGHADTMQLDIADLLDWTGDNALDSIIPDGQKKLIVDGDGSDTLVLNNQDLSDITDGLLPVGITSDFVPLDYFSDGGSYIKFISAGVELFLHSNLVDPDPLG